MNTIKRILCFALTLISILGMALPALALTTTITDEDIPYDFFEYNRTAHGMTSTRLFTAMHPATMPIV